LTRVIRNFNAGQSADRVRGAAVGLRRGRGDSGVLDGLLSALVDMHLMWLPICALTMPMDAVFKALADPSRRQLVDRLTARSGQSLRALCNGLSMARQSVTKHLAVLEAAGVVTTSRRGREKLHFLDAAPINDIAERWMDRYDRARRGTRRP
jgi:DNA-binding transcriptional ArsR family regulator